MLSIPAAAVAGSNLVSNGDFLIGPAFTGWPLSGNTSGVGTGIYSGQQAADFANAGSDAAISQTVATVAGATYTFSFDVSEHGGGTPNDFSAAFGSSIVLSLTDIAAGPYQPYSYTVTANSSATVVEFTGSNTPAGTAFTDVSVTAASAPEPAAWALMLIGVGGIGATLRRRRGLVAAA